MTSRATPQPEVLELVLASNNPHKRVELAARLAHLPVRLVQLESPPDPEETGDTFRDNARLKAEAFVAQSGLPCLADDSGLAVDALGGAPGVYSARFAARAGSPHAERYPSDLANNLLLLEALEGVAERGARFHCDLVLAAPPQSALAGWLAVQSPASLPPGVERLAADTSSASAALACHGTARGVIVPGRPELDAQGQLVVARGSGGFGYDPLFFSDDLGVTFAEATPAQKNRVSHRARALDCLVAALERYFSAESGA